MSNTMELKAEIRTERKKGPNKRLKADGFVPGVYYDSKGENIVLKVSAIPFSKVFSKAGYNKVVDLVVEREGKEETFPCLIWNVDSHPVKPRHEHVDFLGIDPTQEVHLTVQIIATGKAKGVVEGGVMEWYRDSVNIVCLPKNIPDNIVVDVAPLKAGDRIHVEDLPLPEGVSIESEDNFAILGVTMKTAEELAEEEEAAEEESSEAVAEEEGSEA